jgi:hypothetical protein
MIPSAEASPPCASSSPRAGRVNRSMTIDKSIENERLEYLIMNSSG